MRPNPASSLNISRTCRPWTSSGFKIAASVSGSFFSTRPAPAGHFWDDACRGPPCAIHAGPAIDTSPKPSPSCPVSPPTPPAKETPQACPLPWLAPAMEPETLLPPPPSSTHCAGHPSSEISLPRRISSPTVESSPAIGARSPAPLRSMPPFAPASYSSPRVTTPLEPPSIPPGLWLARPPSSPVSLLSCRSAVVFPCLHSAILRLILKANWNKFHQASFYFFCLAKRNRSSHTMLSKFRASPALLNTFGKNFLPQGFTDLAGKAEVENPLGHNRLRRLDPLCGGGDHLSLELFVHEAGRQVSFYRSVIHTLGDPVALAADF